MKINKLALGFGIALVGIILMSKRILIPGFENNTDLIGLLVFFVGFVMAISGLAK